MNDTQRRTAETFDGYKDHYKDAVNDAVSFSGLDVDFFMRVKADYLTEIAAAHFGGADTLQVLDIGCGIGNYHDILAPRFERLRGVDVSSACIETARRRNPDLEYTTYDGAVLPYGDEVFDLAFTICVVHHVPPENWPGFFSEMHRVLRPGGLAVVFEHNPRNPLTMRAVNNCPFDADAVLLKSDKTLSLLRAAGFSSASSRYILSIPAGNRVLRTIDGIFSGLGLGAQYYAAAVKP